MLTIHRAFVLTGCTSSSPSSVNLYLVSLSYQNAPPSQATPQINPDLTATFSRIVNGSTLEVRTSYFGVCASYAGGIWVCSSNSSGLARQLQAYQDPLDLIGASQTFKEGILFSGLLYASMSILSSKLVGTLNILPSYDCSKSFFTTIQCLPKG